MGETVRRRQILMVLQPDLNFGGWVSLQCGSKGKTDIVLDMRTEEWEELGAPAVLTLTLEPGDKLNEEVQSGD